MTSRIALPLLDLTARPTARTCDLRPGASVWYREDVRLDDGASRVVPAVFQAYDRRRHRGAITRGRLDDGSARRTWVALDDVVPRHWGDDVTDDRARLAWVASPMSVDLDAGPVLPLAAVVLAVLLVGLVALWRFWP